MVKLRPLNELDNTEGTVQLHHQSGNGELILHPCPNRNDPNEYITTVRYMNGKLTL